MVPTRAVAALDPFKVLEVPYEAFSRFERPSSATDHFFRYATLVSPIVPLKANGASSK